MKGTKHSEQNEFTMLRSYAGQETNGYIPRKLTPKMLEMIEKAREWDKIREV